MDQHRSPSIFRRPAAGLALLAAAALVIGFVAWPTAQPASQPAVQPASYTSLQSQLRDGSGKGLDTGVFDLWTSISPTPKVPTAWVWVVDDTTDGDGVEYWAYHVDYVHPGADEDAQLTFGFRDDADPANLDEFVDWIVENHKNVGSPDGLLVRNVASVVE